MSASTGNSSARSGALLSVLHPPFFCVTFCLYHVIASVFCRLRLVSCHLLCIASLSVLCHLSFLSRSVCITLSPLCILSPSFCVVLPPVYHIPFLYYATFLLCRLLSVSHHHLSVLWCLLSMSSPFCIISPFLSYASCYLVGVLCPLRSVITSSFSYATFVLCPLRSASCHFSVLCLHLSVSCQHSVASPFCVTPSDLSASFTLLCYVTFLCHAPFCVVSSFCVTPCYLSASFTLLCYVAFLCHVAFLKKITLNVFALPFINVFYKI